MRKIGIAVLIFVVAGLAVRLGIRGDPVTPPDTSGDIEGWKTYRNEKYGFEFKYPGDLSVRADNPRFPSFSNDNPTDKVIINIDADAQYVEEFDPSEKCGTGAFTGGNTVLKKIIVANNQVVLCVGYSELPRGIGSVDYVIVVPKNSAPDPDRKHFEIDLMVEGESRADQYLKIFERILDSLRFF